jgi:hypothetical protein
MPWRRSTLANRVQRAAQLKQPLPLWISPETGAILFGSLLALIIGGGRRAGGVVSAVLAAAVAKCARAWSVR